MASQSSQPHYPPSPIRLLPTHKQQGCRDSRDSLGTVLRETVALSAPSTVTCREQLAHSRTAGTIWSQSRRKIHLFPINNPSLDTDRYSPPAPRWHVKNTPPLTKLQIPVTVTTLMSNTTTVLQLSSKQLCNKQYTQRSVVVVDNAFLLTVALCRVTCVVSSTKHTLKEWKKPGWRHCLAVKVTCNIHTVTWQNEHNELLSVTVWFTNQQPTQ